MNKVILYIAASVDGFIATSDGGVGWLDAFSGTDEDYGYYDLLARIDANIQGANTYNQILNFDIAWPYESKSYVVTNKKLEKPKTGEVEFYKGDLEKLVNKISQKHKKDIWLIGGADLSQQFLRESLVDEIVLSVMPTLLGEGIRLFGGGSLTPAKLIDSKKYKSGVVQLHYSL